MMMLQGGVRKGREVGGAQMSTSVSRRHAGSENVFPSLKCVVWWTLLILVVLSIYCLYVVVYLYALR